jgi:raffinose/stachyose/melibiose transport system permease protein
VLFFPYLISGVGVGLFWTFVLNPQFGALNGLLKGVGLKALARPWLGVPELALGSIIFVVVWWGIGFYMIFLMAGIQTIPMELLDAGRVDGANDRQLFFGITLPFLREFLAVAIVLWAIEALKTFAVVLMLTGGGPAGKTQVLSTYMAQMAFALGSSTGNFRYGYGTAIAVILTVFVVIASLIYFRLRRQETMEF